MLIFSKIGGLTMGDQEILLSKEKETLLGPLYCRARETKKEDPIFEDKKALEIFEKMKYDFSKIKMPEKSCITLVIRADKIDQYVREFIADKKQVTIINLGVGLDNRYGRVNPCNAVWYELDFLEVIELRKKFYQKPDNVHYISSSVTDLKWINQVNSTGEILIVAEGLFMYLKEKKLKELLLKLHKRFPGANLVFDAYSTYTVKNISKHVFLRKTKAEIFWGIDDPKQLEKWGEGIQFKEEWFFTEYEDIKRLSFFYRLAFKAAGLSKIARQAHRILYYKI